MSNKFQKGVLERLELEQKAKPKSSPKEHTNTVTKTKKEEPKERASKEPQAKSKIDVPDIAEYLRVEPQRKMKNKTFYLDEEVIDALTAVARNQKVSDSKICNDILRRILGLDRK